MPTPRKETITVFVGEDEQEMPAKFAVCPSCDGRGTHALHGIAITADEWNGPDWDDDSRDGYLNGRYDTTCEECAGRRVVLVPDRKRATKAQLAAYREDREFDEECRRERETEARMLGEWEG